MSGQPRPEAGCTVCCYGGGRSWRARVADLADQFPIGDTHPQMPGSAAVFDRVGGQLVHREHHVERAAFRHACGGCVREHCLAKDTQRGLTELLVQHAAAPHYPSCICAPAVPEAGCGRTVSTWSMPSSTRILATFGWG